MRNLIECNNVIPQIIVITQEMQTADIIADYATRFAVSPSYITTIAPEKEELTVEQIRELHAMTRFSTTTPTLVAISALDKSSAEVQNMLLKTLEELSERYIFLLFVESVERLTETIRSRCLIRSLVPLSKNLIKKEAISPVDYFSFAKNSEVTREGAIQRIDDYLGQSLVHSLEFTKHLLKIRSLIANNNVDPGMGLDSILLFSLKHSTMKDRHETSK